jgi:hypothetical protein
MLAYLGLHAKLVSKCNKTSCNWHVKEKPKQKKEKQIHVSMELVQWESIDRRLEPTHSVIEKGDSARLPETKY